MSKDFKDKFGEINDDEIRIISSRKTPTPMAEPFRSADNSESFRTRFFNEYRAFTSEDVGPDAEAVTEESSIMEKKVPMLPLREEEPEGVLEESPKEMPAKVSVGSRPRLSWTKWTLIGIIILVGALAVFFWWEVKRDVDGIELRRGRYSELEASAMRTEPLAETPAITSPRGHVEIRDTVVGGEKLTILTPVGVTPQLHVGLDALSDPAATLVVQAADIREDNGGIVGAYVLNGELLSKGQAKSGFCAIIDGKPIIGVATSTPYLEEAIETGGDFFRQYPLVVGGQAVDNRLKYSSYRKALAELDGNLVVILNHNPVTLNEFAQTLVDLGVSTAIYLIGSKAAGFALDSDGSRVDFGEEYADPPANINYIVWK